MLVHTHNGRIDHLHGCVMSGGQCIQPVASGRNDCSRSCRGQSSQADRAMARLIAGPKLPLRKRRSSTRGTQRGLFGNIGLMAAHSKSVSSERMIRSWPTRLTRVNEMHEFQGPGFMCSYQ
jgi:hypothetical protein